MSLFLELLQGSTAFLLFVLTVLGLMVGSFLNVVIHRLPIMMEREWQQEYQHFLHPDQPPEALPVYNLATPASACPNCGHKIRPWQNIPVLSYLMLGGKCAGCRTTISIRYPLVEATGAVLAVLIGLTFGASWQTLVLCPVAWALLALTMIDLDTQLLPDVITLPLLWAGLMVNSFAVIVPLSDALWGAVGGYLTLWTVYHVFKALTGKEGMGYGDFKLLAALGAWLGWLMLLPMIILSSLVGLVLAVGFIAKQGRSEPMPFGPSIAIAGLIAMLWGQPLLSACQLWLRSL